MDCYTEPKKRKSNHQQKRKKEKKNTTQFLHRLFGLRTVSGVHTDVLIDRLLTAGENTRLDYTRTLTGRSVVLTLGDDFGAGAAQNITTHPAPMATLSFSSHHISNRPSFSAQLLQIHAVVNYQSRPGLTKINSGGPETTRSV